MSRSPSFELPDHDPNPNRASIDLSMELERQLESEVDAGGPPLTKNQISSLDPNVLVHLVTQLRESVNHLNQEKEDLVKQLAESHLRIAEFKDTISLLTERCAGLEHDLEAARTKNKDDEEAISMLRSKVEESRQGLMRLQSERNAENSSKQKRMTLDLNAVRTPSWGSPRSANRTSFTPLAGSGLVSPNLSRRTPSLSVNDNDPGFAAFIASLPNSPLENGNDPANRRRSRFGVSRTPPSSSERVSPGRVSPAFAEMESIKRQLAAVQTELEEARHELQESNEAREASDSCVKALRDYISQLGPGDSPSLMPATNIPQNTQKGEHKSSKSSGWNLTSLWGSANQPTENMTVLKQRTASIASDDPNSPAQGLPLRSKFGSLFSRGTSISSTSTRPLSADFNHDEPILNGSDGSSIVETSEPASPSFADKNPSVYVHHAVEEDTPTPSDQGHVKQTHI
ncbi:hypothetical protein Clacol_005432 [Clathrus columnatus]|uniref:Uncharacterized protein n=1 Tax=Clathrus columnatus TaxID=1419009 RepID=A0AAV5AGZ4_9AGAM|nr:hypothetical protein Clacol_005432 [Clathrus columnatus]